MPRKHITVKRMGPFTRSKHQALVDEDAEESKKRRKMKGKYVLTPSAVTVKIDSSTENSPAPPLSPRK